MSSSAPISFTISFRGTSRVLSYSPDTTVAAFQGHLEELTHVPPSLQKLLSKGKNLLNAASNHQSEMTLAQAGIRNGFKIHILGSTLRELTSLQSTEDEQKKRERILRERALNPPVKLRSTHLSTSSSQKYRFHHLTPLSHLPNPSAALTLLSRLSEDPAVKYIIHKNAFSVGVLTELAPHEHPGLLGLNVNHGEAIKLRLRTDRYDGFRLYSDVRKVLCHELAHNVWGDHDENFKELNSKLNREVAEFERAAARGVHTLLGSGDFYEPSVADLEADHGVHIHVLGGGSGSGWVPLKETIEERRRRVLEATMARLRKEEEALEKACGNEQHA